MILFALCTQLTNKASSLSRFDYNELWIGDVAGRVSLMDATAHQYKLVQVRLFRCASYSYKMNDCLLAVLFSA